MTSSAPNSAATPDMAHVQTLLKKARSRIEHYQAERDARIAIIGMAGRFPGADDLAAFWDLLAEGRSGLRAVTAEELEAAGVPPDLAADPDYRAVWGGPTEADGFDAAFFGYAPREAELLDPQHRIFLECAWHALEDAGYGAGERGGAGEPGRPVGVYAGAALGGYLTHAAAGTDPFQAALSNLAGMVAARVSFHMDLTGPSLGVQTTCSTALVAVHQAVQALRRGECGMALAGAVAVNQARPAGYRYQPEGIGAPDGICRPFDAGAAGTIFANGVGVLVLKRLADALADGDTVHGVILGSAVNNDGAGKISLTAPSVAGQAAVLEAALKNARIGAADVDYVEAHGTATPLGDPIEVAALNRAYGPGLAAAGRGCALGSVKGNVGHLDAAAGMAGLMKLLLALRHGRLPGTAHFTTPNPKCAFDDGPFRVSATPQDWPRNPARPRRAAISSFGIGGTNAHLILEEPPLPTPTGAAESTAILPLSARTPAALSALRHALADALEAPDAPDLAAAAFTLQTGRRALATRQVITAASREAAVAALRAGAEPVHPMAGRPSLAFVFSGQGSQQAGMARGLYADAGFRAALDACLALMPADLDLRRLLLETVDDPAIDQTRITQPALFAMEYALAQMWMARGVQPVALLGHSIGEYAAACIAGVFSLPDAVRLVCARGALMQACAPGAMLSVMLSERGAAAALPEGVEIAAVNAPRSVVLAGPVDTITGMAERLDRSGIACRILRTSHAFHSATMEPALEPFRAVLAGVALHAPQISMLSNVTGDWLTGAEATDPDYWLRQLRQAVQYGPSVARLMALSDPLLLEVGPGSQLIRLARQQLSSNARVVASLPEGKAGAEDALGALWMAGVSVDWQALHTAPRRVSLPGYPFERQSFWMPPASAARQAEDVRDKALPDWFHQPVWQRLPSTPAQMPGRMLVLGADDITLALGPLPAGSIAVRASADGSFSTGAEGFSLDPRNRDHYRRLFATEGFAPDSIVNAFGLTTGDALLFDSTVALARALAEQPLRPPLTLLGAGMQEVTGAETLRPDAAIALGLVPVLPQETGLPCRSLDLDPAELSRLVDGLADALATPFDAAKAMALRRGYLWRGDHAPVRLEPAAVPVLAKGATCLITGDLVEGLALAYATGLRRDLDAKLILAGTGLPPLAEWDGWLATHGPDHPASRMILGLRQLGTAGVDYALHSGDAGDAAWLEQALHKAEAGFGPVRGAFHTAAMGDASHCPLEDTSPDMATRLVGAKLRGIAALREVLGRRQPAFCLVQSSLSVLAGGPGFAAYAAANAYLDAAVAAARRQGATVWQAVQWDVCETGSLGAATLRGIRVLTADDVWQASRAVMANPRIAGVAVTPNSLGARLTAQHRPAVAEAAPQRRNTTPYIAPRDAYEAATATAMADMLGVPQVGAEDNFFELGGHSLLAIQIIARLRREFGVDLPVRALLYEAPTVAGIAAVVRAAREAAGAEEDLLGQLLDGIEQQSRETAD